MNRMKRELIETRANGDMLVIDSFGETYFAAGIITTELRPTTVYKRLATAESRAEAICIFKREAEQ